MIVVFPDYTHFLKGGLNTFAHHNLSYFLVSLLTVGRCTVHMKRSMKLMNPDQTTPEEQSDVGLYYRDSTCVFMQ